MISDKAVDSVVVGDCVSGSKFDDDFDIAISREYPFGLIELKDVTRVSEELVLCVEL